NQALSVSGPIVIPADIAGIVHAGTTNTAQEYALLDRLEVSWILRTFNWSSIEAVEGQWNFDSYDPYVDIANEAGKKVLGVLAYDIGWIHEDGKRHNYISSDKLDFFLNYVRQTVAHFQGRVDAWCIWNEPNTTHFWTGSLDEYLVLTRRAADAVREVDPDVTLLAGAFNRGYLGLPKAFIRGLFESGAMEKVDGIAFHPYELNPSRSAKLYDKFRALVAPYGFADRIWITEMGYPTSGKYPTKVAEKKFPEYVVKSFVNLAIRGAEKILWYQLFDPINRVSSDSEDFFGLVRSREDYTSKGAEAFRLCATYIAGTVYRPDLPHREKLPGSLKTFYFERMDGEGGALVLWKTGSSAQITLKFSNAEAGGGLFTVHDPVSGNAVEMSPGTVLSVGTVPVFVSWQGSLIPEIE
ncbi:MAG: hypothetical protein LBI14_11600, partial [Treponema sp.]|nr:hypothetical protein [Treponema sp.]